MRQEQSALEEQLQEFDPLEIDAGLTVDLQERLRRVRDGLKIWADAEKQIAHAAKQIRAAAGQRITQRLWRG